MRADGHGDRAIAAAQDHVTRRRSIAVLNPGLSDAGLEVLHGGCFRLPGRFSTGKLAGIARIGSETVERAVRPPGERKNGAEVTAVTRIAGDGAEFFLRD